MIDLGLHGHVSVEDLLAREVQQAVEVLTALANDLAHVMRKMVALRTDYVPCARENGVEIELRNGVITTVIYGASADACRSARLSIGVIMRDVRGPSIRVMTAHEATTHHIATVADIAALGVPVDVALEVDGELARRGPFDLILCDGRPWRPRREGVHVDQVHKTHVESIAVNVCIDPGFLTSMRSVGRGIEAIMRSDYASAEREFMDAKREMESAT